MKNILVEHEKYHVYQRGNSKNIIFFQPEDYERFMKLLYICNSEKSFKFRDSIIEQKIDAWDFDRGTPLVDIAAWVLMPNHFHIQLTSHRSDLWEKGINPISEFMRKLCTSYVMYINNKYARSGTLFEGKFKSKHINTDEYFNYLFAYIHLNPLALVYADWKTKGIQNTEEAMQYLAHYYYSSFYDVVSVGIRKQKLILSQDAYPVEFRLAHRGELMNWIKNSPQVRPVGNS